jgi:hypothetical protein
LPCKFDCTLTCLFCFSDEDEEAGLSDDDQEAGNKEDMAMVVHQSEPSAHEVAVDRFRDAMLFLVSSDERDLRAAFFPSGLVPGGLGTAWTDSDWNARLKSYESASRYNNVLSMLCHLRIFAVYSDLYYELFAGNGSRKAVSRATERTMSLFPNFAHNSHYFNKKKVALEFFVSMMKLHGRDILLCSDMTITNLMRISSKARDLLRKKIAHDRLGNESFDMFFGFIVQNRIFPEDTFLTRLIDTGQTWKNAVIDPHVWPLCDLPLADDEAALEEVMSPSLFSSPRALESIPPTPPARSIVNSPRSSPVSPSKSPAKKSKSSSHTREQSVDNLSSSQSGSSSTGRTTRNSRKATEEDQELELALLHSAAEARNSQSIVVEDESDDLVDSAEEYDSDISEAV